MIKIISILFFLFCSTTHALSLGPDPLVNRLAGNSKFLMAAKENYIWNYWMGYSAATERLKKKEIIDAALRYLINPDDGLLGSEQLAEIIISTHDDFDLDIFFNNLDSSSFFNALIYEKREIGRGMLKHFIKSRHLAGAINPKCPCTFAIARKTKANTPLEILLKKSVDNLATTVVDGLQTLSQLSPERLQNFYRQAALAWNISEEEVRQIPYRRANLSLTLAAWRLMYGTEDTQSSIHSLAFQEIVNFGSKDLNNLKAYLTCIREQPYPGHRDAVMSRKSPYFVHLRKAMFEEFLRNDASGFSAFQQRNLNLFDKGDISNIRTLQQEIEARKAAEKIELQQQKLRKMKFLKAFRERFSKPSSLNLSAYLNSFEFGDAYRLYEISFRSQDLASLVEYQPLTLNTPLEFRTALDIIAPVTYSPEPKIENLSPLVGKEEPELSLQAISPIVVPEEMISNDAVAKDVKDGKSKSLLSEQEDAQTTEAFLDATPQEDLSEKIDEAIEKIEDDRFLAEEHDPELEALVEAAMQFSKENQKFISESEKSIEDHLLALDNFFDKIKQEKRTDELHLSREIIKDACALVQVQSVESTVSSEPAMCNAVDVPDERFDMNLLNQWTKKEKSLLAMSLLDENWWPTFIELFSPFLKAYELEYLWQIFQQNRYFFSDYNRLVVACRQLLKDNLSIVEGMQKDIEDTEIRFYIFPEAVINHEIESTLRAMISAPGVSILHHPGAQFCRMHRALISKSEQEKLSVVESWLLRTSPERIDLAKNYFPDAFMKVGEDLGRRNQFCLEFLSRLETSKRRLLNLSAQLEEYKGRRKKSESMQQ